MIILRAPDSALTGHTTTPNDDAGSGWRNRNRAHNVSSVVMLFLPCHPRFALLLSSLLTTAVALLLPFSPIPSLPPSSHQRDCLVLLLVLKGLPPICGAHWQNVPT